jgi:hypothetical protein
VVVALKDVREVEVPAGSRGPGRPRRQPSEGEPASVPAENGMEARPSEEDEADNEVPAENGISEAVAESELSADAPAQSEPAPDPAARPETGDGSVGG